MTRRLRWLGARGARMVFAGWPALTLIAACAGINPRNAGGKDGAAGPLDGSMSVNLGGDGAVGRVIGGGPLGDTACVTQTQKAARLPLDMYIMMDSSSSMDELTATNQTKWDAVKAAVTTFVQDPQSAGLGVGIQYFPLVRPGVATSCAADGACGANGPCLLLKTCDTGSTIVPCNTSADCGAGGSCIMLGQCLVTGEICAPAGLVCAGARTNVCQAIPGYCSGRDRCEAAAYAAPAVEVATLPGAQAALVASLAQHVTDGLTPTSGALSGAVMHAQALARANPTHRVAVLLATDGLPSECTPSDIAGVAALAAAGQAGTPAISTFVIGVFAPAEQSSAQANLDALAMAGGTGQAFVINTGQNVTQAFVSALNTIRNAGLSCQYKIPASPDGGTLDYFSVNVEFTSGAGQTVTIGNVRDKASCHPTQGGWYYDANPATGGMPQTISICDTSCTPLRADPAGRVDILLGCKTEVIVP